MMQTLTSFQAALSLANRRLILPFAAKPAIPALYQATPFAEAGGLMTWASNLENRAYDPHSR